MVHCFGGVSRSVSTVVYYLMRYRKMDVVDAAALVKRKHSDASPIRGFVRQLCLHQTRLPSQST